MSTRVAGLLLCLVSALLFVPLVTSCGGKGAQSTSAAASSAVNSAVSPTVKTGSDADFVKGLCVAAGAFVDRVTKDTQAALTPQPGTDGSPAATPDFGSAFIALFQAIAPAYGTFVEQMAKLKPPPDLAPWFEQAQPKMAAAAKALKDGNFTDPALANLGSDPFPAMPDGPRMRLQALAAKTRECDGLDAFAPAGSTGSFGDAGQPPKHSQKISLQKAATGAWTGPYGTLKFNADGNVDFNIRLCGISTDATNAFGVDDSCEPQEFKGKLTVDDHGFEIGDPGGGANVLQAYIDSSGKLHIGVGSLGELDDDRTGVVDIFAESSLTVKKDGCERANPNGSGMVPVVCKWLTEDGQQVLQFTDALGDTQSLVWVPGQNLLVDPTIFVSAFAK